MLLTGNCGSIATAAPLAKSLKATFSDQLGQQFQSWPAIQTGPRPNVRISKRILARHLDNQILEFGLTQS